MKKRFLCALLCAVMIIPMAFTGCGSSGTVSSAGSSATPMTITIYTITDEKTTEAGLAQAQDAINKITEYDFNTHIILKAFTADEYDTALEDDLAAMKANYIEPEETTTESTAVVTDANGEAETTTAESKVYVKREDIVYPDLNGTQADIVLITSIDQFNRLVQNGDIQALDDELIGASKIITKFVNPTMLNAAVGIDKMHYAIPNNRCAGEYEYLLLRKDLVDSYYYDPTDIHTILQLEEYVNDVLKLNPDYTPVLDTYGVSTLSLSMLGEDSLFGSYVGYNAQPNTNAMPKVLPTVSKYRRELAYLKTLRDSGNMVSGELSADSKAAAVFLKGDPTVPEKYADDYYVNVYKYPTATNENTFDSMYAVSTYTKSLARCMEIVTYMMTNIDFRNTFQYGERDTNYSIDKNNFVTVLNDDYVMDTKYTGNEFILYQNDRMTDAELALSANDWELGKKQNTEMVASSYLGFSALTTEVAFEDEEGMTDSDFSTAEMFGQIKAASDEYQKKIAEYDQYVAANGAMAYTDYLEMLGNEMAANQYIKAALNKRYKNSPFAKYVAWYKQLYKSEETTTG